MKRIIIFLSCLIASFYEINGSQIKSNISARQISVLSQEEAFENPYVTDGLIAMYDGEWNVGFGKHDSNTLVWKDLIGNNDITYSVQSLDLNRYWLDNGFYQFYSGMFYFQSTPSVEMTYILKNGLPFTVEVVAEVTEIPSSGNSSLINIADGMQSSGLMLSYNSLVFASGCVDSWGSLNSIRISNSWAYMSMPFHCGMSMNGANEYGYMFFKTLNGEIEGHSSSIKQNILTIDLTKMIIGGYAWSSIASRNHRGMLYCIRIYNRALSTDELDFNYNVDKERFGL